MTRNAVETTNLRLWVFVAAIALAPISVSLFGLVGAMIFEMDLSLVSLLFLAALSAPVFGTAPYIFLGNPWMWYWAQKLGVTPLKMATAAVVANVFSPIFVIAQISVLDGPLWGGWTEIVMTIFFVWTFGTVFSAIYGLLVGTFYRKLDRIFPRQKSA